MFFSTVSIWILKYLDSIFPSRKKFLAKCNREYSTKFEIEKRLSAVVIFLKDYIVCSNLSDIVSYCKQYEIRYLTTMDILLEANYLGLMSEQDCNDFIKVVKDMDSKLIKGIETI